MSIHNTHNRKNQNVVLNVDGGYILRSKPMAVNEGGLGIGAGSLDLPTLIPSQEFISGYE